MDCDVPFTYADYDRALVCRTLHAEVDLEARCETPSDVLVLHVMQLASGTYKIVARCSEYFSNPERYEPAIEVAE